jgi:hypothetical protein
MICNCLYCKVFLRPETLTHSIWLPIQRLWFSVPRYIIRKNFRRDPEETGFTMRLKPFLGYVLFVREGERIPIAWWKKLYKANRH